MQDLERRGCESCEIWKCFEIGRKWDFEKQIKVRMSLLAPQVFLAEVRSEVHPSHPICPPVAFEHLSLYNTVYTVYTVYIQKR